MQKMGGLAAEVRMVTVAQAARTSWNRFRAQTGMNNSTKSILSSRRRAPWVAQSYSLRKRPSCRENRWCTKTSTKWIRRNHQSSLMWQVSRKSMKTLMTSCMRMAGLSGGAVSMRKPNLNTRENAMAGGKERGFTLILSQKSSWRIWTRIYMSDWKRAAAPSLIGNAWRSSSSFWKCATEGSMKGPPPLRLSKRSQRINRKRSTIGSHLSWSSRITTIF